MFAVHLAIRQDCKAAPVMSTLCLAVIDFADAQQTDFSGASNFFLLALLTLVWGETYYARNVVASVVRHACPHNPTYAWLILQQFVFVWSVRLSTFLLYRVLQRGSDSRFDEASLL